MESGCDGYAQAQTFARLLELPETLDVHRPFLHVPDISEPDLSHSAVQEAWRRYSRKEAPF